MNASYFIQIITVFLSLTLGQTTLAQTPTIPISIQSEHGTYTIQAEIAANETSRNQGLMFREKLDKDYGMIFLFPKAQPVNMWMKNTPLSLDIWFINDDGKIIDITENTTPHSLKTISSPSKVRAVIEVIAGTSKIHSIQQEDTVLDFDQILQHIR